MWYDLGLKSGEGRSARTFAKAAGKDDVSQKILALTDGQSIFDPVLCELAYRWFCPQGGDILDPFAGGSVRGIVAATLGRRYAGIDLSADQVEANIAQSHDFVARGIYARERAPVWVVGDSAEVLRAKDQTRVDFVWSCPPYHDLEKYSDDPRDLSNMPWSKFCGIYRDIIGRSIDCLRDDRFAGFVVGEIRGPDGLYRHFVEETVAAFEAAGAAYYNEALLVSPAGTLPLRAAKQWVVSRKMGRTHQTVLIFVKGDPRKATAECEDLDAVRASVRAMGHDLDAIEDVPDEDFSGMEHG